MRVSRKTAGHADFDCFEEQLREEGNPGWLAYDLRVMFQVVLSSVDSATWRTRRRALLLCLGTAENV